MKLKRIVSAFLTTVMFLGSLVVPAEAAYADKVDEDGVPLIDYLNTNYESRTATSCGTRSSPVKSP